MTALVRIDGVTRRFGQGARTVTVLESIFLTIAMGEYVAVTGVSGSGKSSLMNLIGLLDRPDNGTLRFKGQDTNAISARELAGLRNRHIGFVFQSYHLLPGRTALANVALPLAYLGVPRRQRLAAAEEALADVGLSHRLCARPATLSGGEQQRVAIARALVADPDLIVADEPTGALDQASGDQVMDLFERFHMQGRTIVLVTHDPAVAARASRQVELKGGRIERDTGGWFQAA